MHVVKAVEGRYSEMGALIEVRGLWQEFHVGDKCVAALQNINLVIEAGEMVAIVGPSGSGKSTLMNILGCLHKPTRGQYKIAGHATESLPEAHMALLRREHFGFVFQRYHLLDDQSALTNVEIPAIYAGMTSRARSQRAHQLLAQFGLNDYLQHRPGQLSGGQQQRVGIARALMNGAEVILADEPTGALDQATGLEVITALKKLHQQGHTIILVTHDAQIAAHAQRVIELHDGRIIADSRLPCAMKSAPEKQIDRTASDNATNNYFERIYEDLRMAWSTTLAHRLRTFMTMLGVVIGIASVVSVVALGEGARQRVLSDISSMGTNTIDIMAGSGFGDPRAKVIRTLRETDAVALAQLDYVDSVTPSISSSADLRHGSVHAMATLNGVGNHYFRVHGYTFSVGQPFDLAEVAMSSQVAVIDENTRKTFFAAGEEPIGSVIMLGGVPLRIVGVLKTNNSPFSKNNSLQVWIPYTTAMTRITGREIQFAITLRLRESVQSAFAEKGIHSLLTQLHGKTDFFLLNSNSIREAVETANQTLTLLVSSIACISLIVGSIGVMNIMLVSVAERTREIGLRIAVGARHSDIVRQFLIEAVVVCLVAGCLGIVLALTISFAVNHLTSGFMMIISIESMGGAFVVSTLTGLLAGLQPAFKAANLDPVAALTR